MLNLLAKNSGHEYLFLLLLFCFYSGKYQAHTFNYKYLKQKSDIKKIITFIHSNMEKTTMYIIKTIQMYHTV